MSDQENDQVQDRLNDDEGDLRREVDQEDGDEEEEEQPSHQAPADNNNDGGDDDDEEEEEDEDEDEMPSRKRARKRRGNMFVDVEAEVDDDDEEVDEDDHELLKEDGFIEHDQPEEAERDDRLHREVDRKREAIEDEDVERLADEYRERYGRSSTSRIRGDQGDVPQRLLLPSVHDPNIWGVRCKPGKERELVRSILKKKENLQYTKQPLEILSAFQRDTFTGYVYIEARRQTAVEQALAGFPNVYKQQMVLVPIKEYPDMFRVNKSRETELIPGAYVRVKRGKYQGDLAIVENISENGLKAQLKIVPRLDYGKNRVSNALDGSKRKRAARPPARLFSANEAKTHDKANLSQRNENVAMYAGEEYENGYLKKDFKITHLMTEGVNPRLEEIQQFTGASEDGIDLSAVSESLKQTTAVQTFQAGDQVEVARGEQAGMKGKVLSMQNNIVTILGAGDIMRNERIDVPSENLRKRFDVGDHVRVVNGNYKDDTGMVVASDADSVTFVSDLSQTEVTVFGKDLKAASDIGGATTLGKFELHDLVQLNAQTVGVICKIERDSVGVLDQDGSMRTLAPSAITMKMTKGDISATDRKGQEVRVGDTVREISGQRRQGAILHIYRTSVFVHGRHIQENLGVFASRITNIETVAAKGARGTVSNDLNKMNPAVKTQMPPPMVKSGGRDRILGNKVLIGKGSQHKGLRGTVRDATDREARVELEAKNKVVTVKKESLLFPDKDGRNVPYNDFVSQRMGRPPPPGGGGPGGPPRPPAYMATGFGGPAGGASAWGGGNGPSGPGGRTPGMGARTPAWYGGKTPAGAAPGHRTPGWNAGTGKTPAGYSGGRTSAWNGGKTPAWSGGGSKTPAWSGGKTPGAKTPAWTAVPAGGKTPAFGGGGKTPAFGATEREPKVADTPGFLDAPTPYAAAQTPGAFAAPTPGAYNSAPTPGFKQEEDEDTKYNMTAPTPGAYDAKTPGVAQTPGVWHNGDDSDEEDEEQIKYEPTSDAESP